MGSTCAWPVLGNFPVVDTAVDVDDLVSGALATCIIIRTMLLFDRVPFARHEQDLLIKH